MMAKDTGSQMMYWVRNLSCISNNPIQEIEYELASESKIVGVLDYGDSSIVCGPLSLHPDKNGQYKYLLKLRLSSGDMLSPKKTRSNYLLKEGIIGELLSILSIALEARFFVLSRTSGVLCSGSLKTKTEYNPLFKTCNSDIDPVLLANRERNLNTEVSPILDMIRLIPEDYHQELSSALFHYAKALRDVAIDDEMVFVRLVSAIEVVASKMRVPSNIDILACRPLREFIRDDVLSSEELEEVEKVFRVRNAKCRFVGVLVEYSKEFFDKRVSDTSITMIRQSDLPKKAKAIYDARSAYLHSGVPMYLSTRIRDQHQWDQDPSLSMAVGDRLFSSNHKLPYPYFFHSLVRHCLLRYLKSLVPAA